MAAEHIALFEPSAAISGAFSGRFREFGQVLCHLTHRKTSVDTNIVVGDICYTKITMQDCWSSDATQ
jgi:hypothetical protein